MEQKYIRNFAIIAHIDHGKSTLADRLLELTHTISKEKLRAQYLDRHPISRERGITIKLAPVRMIYKTQNPNIEIRNRSKNQNHPKDFEFTNSEYIFNLIDTPGHVDFSYEVSRTLAACEGAVLLVDATQGIQAQTVAHFQSAKKEGLKIIPVINKIDLSTANTSSVAKTLVEILGFSEDEIIYISAKTGKNVDQLLKKIVRDIPAPRGESQRALRALIFDAYYDEHRGVIAYVRIVDGKINSGEKIRFLQNSAQTDTKEVGYFQPFLFSSGALLTGEVGYIVTGMKNMKQVRVGDTIVPAAINDSEIGLPGYKTPKPMVFLGVYPRSANELVKLKQSLEKLSLNDTSLTYSNEHSNFLGNGFRVGFLGLLHAEIVKERLRADFSLDPIFTMPHISYQKDAADNWLEPYISLIVYTPNEHMGNVMAVCQKGKGELIDLSYQSAFAVLSYEIPYSALIHGLASELKTVSAGFASIDYEPIGYKTANLAKMEIHINGEPIDVLSDVVCKDDAVHIAREKAEMLKNSLQRQQFRQIIQGVIDGNIVVREDIPAYRKDVLAKMSGGDRTRKDKLLDKQKEGKSRMISHAKVNIPQEALLSLLKN